MDAALTMVDSLDTLWLYDMTEEFKEARDWIKDNVNLDYDNNRVSVFESTIRLLGGFLSAFHLSKDPVFLTKAVSLHFDNAHFSEILLNYILWNI